MVLTAAILTLACGTEASGEDSMSQNPPGRWEMETGVWGVNAFQDDVVTQSGGFAVLLSSSAATRIQSQPIPVRSGHVYQVKAIAQASSVAAGRTVTIDAVWLDSAQAVISTSTVHNTVLPGTGTWYELSDVIEAPSTTRYVVIRAAKPAFSFSVYLDYVGISRAPRLSEVSRAATQVIGPGAWTTVQFTAEAIDHGDMYNNTASASPRPAWSWTCPKTGLWAISALSVGNGSTAVTGQNMQARLTLNTAVWRHGSWDMLTAGAGAEFHSLFCTEPAAYLSRGDNIVFQVYTNEAGGMIIGGGADLCYLSATELDF